MNFPKSFRRPFHQRGKYYRLNYNITAQTLRVLDQAGKQIGVFSKDEALRRARDQGVDLVEIAPLAKPPVCKIIDFKKFKYLESKKERENRKKAKHVELKQIMLSPFIQKHDLETKGNRAREFLEDGHKLKLVVKFKGRQLGKKEFGFEIINKFIQGLAQVAAVEREAHLEGPMVVATLVPSKKKVSYENETKNEKGNSETVQSNQIRQDVKAPSKQPPLKKQEEQKPEKKI